MKVLDLEKKIHYHPDTDKIYLCTKDQYKAKYQLIINKRESTGLKNWNDFKAAVQYSIDMDDTFENIEQYNPNKTCKFIWLYDCWYI